MTTENTKANIREYQIRAGLTDTFGRLICNTRHHHFVVDGPAQNGCPGEALTPPEIFLAGVITCGVELVQVFARDKNLSLRSATGIISATLDRSNQARSDVTLLNSVRLDFTLTGVSHESWLPHRPVRAQLRHTVLQVRTSLKLDRDSMHVWLGARIPCC